MDRAILFILLLLISFTIQAQLKIHAGGGVNFSNIDFKNIEIPEINSSTNYYLSVRPEIGITKSLSAGLDIQFSQKGYGYKDVISGPVVGYRFQYLDLIPQVQYKFLSQLAVFGGLGVGVRTSEKTNLSNVWTETKTKLSKPADFTYIAGLRVFPFQKIYIHAQFAGTLGSFLDVEWTDAEGKLIPDVSTKLNNIQLGVGYQFY
jgi:opacity protein-like surface antigen